MIRPQQIPILSDDEALAKLRDAFKRGEPRHFRYVAQKVHLSYEQCRRLMTRANGFVEREEGWFDFNPLVAQLYCTSDTFR